jgi:ubiquinone biosynthesis accessory factor UbiK
MWKPKQLDALVQQLLNAIPTGARELPQDLGKNFHAILESTFAKLHLVTREEFDAQVRVLRRTWDKLHELENKLKELEKKKEEE